MQEINGFIQRIVEDPYDVDVRLIFADWLQDHDGDAYAEFIRVQVELEERSVCPVWCPGPDHCETAALRRREAELLKHNWMAFAGEPALRLVNFCKRKGRASLPPRFC
jgi:uncharacterized protein (TIGR02996 family)